MLKPYNRKKYSQITQLDPDMHTTVSFTVDPVILIIAVTASTLTRKYNISPKSAA